jgi:hypothetical protein
MKTSRTLVYLPFLVFFAACDSQEKTKEYSTIFFSNRKIAIGNVVVGTTKQIEFYAVNKSETPLIIDSVKSGCSCTVSTFPKKPILKNDSGLIIAMYTPTKNNIGIIEKSVVVLSNTKPAFTVLTFTGKVSDN